MTGKSKSSPPKTPATAPSGTRSKPKGARASSSGKRRTTAYPAKVKARALEVLADGGVGAAHAETGVPKPTLSRWAKAAKIDLGEEARRRTARATESVRARHAEVKATTLELLEGHITQAGTFLATVAGVNALAAQRIAGADPDRIEVKTGIAGPYAVVNDVDAAEVAKVALALAGLPLAVRDAEGILTRAIHDLQLLRGEATERGELVVEFGGIPRPDPRAQEVQTFKHDDDA